MLATLSLVIRHEALARRGETIYRKVFRSACQLRHSRLFGITLVDCLLAIGGRAN